jgi:hypothetical protein
MKKIVFNTKRIQEIANRITIPNNGKKSISMNEMISRMRNHIAEQVVQNRHLTDSELDIEKKKFENTLANFNVVCEYEPFMIVNGGVIWGGTIDNQIQWVFKVTEDDQTSGVELNFSSDFNPDEGDNKRIVDTIQSYYNQFYKYWRDNELELDNNNIQPQY